MSRRRLSKCPTGKTGFSTHRRAMHSANKIADMSCSDKVPIRAYHCEYCDRWHLTCQPRRKDQLYADSRCHQSSQFETW